MSTTTEHKWEPLPAYAIADDAGCHYTGDVNVVDHDGTFYSIEHWEAYGYAECVRFYRCEGRLYVECATINRPERGELVRMLSELDLDFEINEENRVHVEIVETLYHWGAETSEDFSGPFIQTFDADEFGDVNESEVWPAVESWIRSLSA